MAERTISATTYVIVCIILILLTILTVGISFLEVAGVWHVVFGLTIAVCKASLVVLFFMHALISSRVTWLVIVISISWLCLLVGLTLCDYATRGMIPFMPGH